MSAYRAVLFDLDGTLLSTVEDLAAAANPALEVFGYPTHPTEVLGRMVGHGIANLMAQALPGGYGNPDHPAVLAEFRTYYSAHVADATRPYPGMPELAAALKARGVRTALVTNKFQAGAEALMARFFPGLLDAVVGDDPSHARKPDPSGVRLALERLGVGADGAVYVGDTEVDLQTAENAGLPCVCVSWGYRSRAELEALGAPRIADTAAELERFLT